MDYLQHFNQQTANYQLFRPVYPKALYEYLFKLVQGEGRVWDCATGNGQTVIDLSARFDQVIASDIYQAPLQIAPKIKNVNYLCCSAEQVPLLDQSMDLITVAQALHWFDLKLFYEEVNRILKPSGLIAAWCYSLVEINSLLDPVISKLYTEILKAYWPSERRYIDEAYRSIYFPFQDKKIKSFTIEITMNFLQLLGYLNTWSALKEYQKQHNKNPLELVYRELEQAWGNLKLPHKLSWPLHVLTGYL